MYFSGWRGSMLLTDNDVVIKRDGFGEHTIPLSQIVTVIIREPSMLGNGMIHIQTLTDSANNHVFNSKLDLAKDRNTVAFVKSDLDKARKMKKAIEEAIASFQTSGSNSINSATSSNAADDIESQLIKCKELLDKGLITAEDYEKKKAALLGI